MSKGDSMQPKRLRIVQKGYEKYSGPIGAYEFKDGVSVEALPRMNRDRLAVAFQFVEINEDGSEQPSGVTHRLVEERDLRKPVEAKLIRQTEEERAAEQVALVEKKRPVRVIYTDEQVHEIMSSKGIAGLREIAQPWGVKHRSAKVLMQMILDEQKIWVEKNGLVKPLPAPAEQPEPVTPLPTPEPVAPVAEPVAEPKPEQNAAVTGDLSAAINAEDK